MKNFLQNSTKQNRVKKAIKNTLGVGGVVVWLFTTNACTPEKTKQLETSKITNIHNNPQKSQNVWVISMKSENSHKLCNYTRVEVNGKIMDITAAHCVGKDVPIDISISENIEQEIEKNTWNNYDVWLEKWFHKPKIHKISQLIPEEIKQHQAKIEWCYPDLQKVTCFRIEGDIEYFDEEKNQYLMYLANEDYDRLRQWNTNPHRKGLEWISGSIVFDKNNDIIGVISSAAKTSSLLFYDLPGVPVLITGVSRE